jgi:hypothetical protein
MFTRKLLETYWVAPFSRCVWNYTFQLVDRLREIFLRTDYHIQYSIQATRILILNSVLPVVLLSQSPDFRQKMYESVLHQLTIETTIIPQLHQHIHIISQMQHLNKNCLTDSNNLFVDKNHELSSTILT